MMGTRARPSQLRVPAAVRQWQAEAARQAARQVKRATGHRKRQRRKHQRLSEKGLV